MTNSSERLIVFDLDGTLVDSQKALLEAHEEAWTSVGLVRPSAEKILELIGLPLDHIMRTLDPNQDHALLVEAYQRAYKRTSESYESLFEGIPDLLNRRFRAAVATGKSQIGAERAVRRHGLCDRFELVLGGNAVPRPKPFPDMLTHIMERTGTQDLVMIGDTTYDLEMAQAAGVPAIGVSWGHHTTERLEEWAPVVDTVSALTALLSV